MQLTPSQELDLANALRLAYATEAVFDALLNRVNQTLQGNSVLNDLYLDKVRSVVARANRNAWLQQLIKKALQDHPADPALLAISAAAQAVVPEDIDPFDVCRLSGAYLMVDRKDLRAALKELDSQTGRRILIVPAGERLGKSHSVQLILYGYMVKESFRVVLIDLEDMQRQIGIGALDPRALATRLVKELQYAVTAEDAPTLGLWSKWVSDFILAINPLAQNEKVYTWIVLDQLNKVDLKEPTLDLIKSIAMRINTTWTRFRLVLLGYTDVLPPECAGHVQQEDIRLIDEREVVSFFLQAFAEMKRVKDDAEVQAIVQKVLERVPLERADTPRLLHSVATEQLALAVKEGP